MDHRHWPRAHPPAPPVYEPTHAGARGGFPPPPRPPGAGDRDGWPTPAGHRIPEGLSPGWRGALLGGLVGAVVAATVSLALIVLTDDSSTLEITGQTVTSRPNLGLTGEGLDIQGLLAAAQPSVVTVQTGQSTIRGIFDGAGSGVLISEDGLVLTNAHVIAGADSMTVTLADGTSHGATLVGSNPDDDIALIQIEEVSGLVPATLGVSADLQVGDEVVAIGNALNLGGTPSVTTGIVSATGRAIEAPGVSLSDLIQTDAAINPGNSGGPLINARGEVVGINTAIIEEAQNIGFAIAIDSIKPLIDEIAAGNGTINSDTTFLGVSTISISELSAAEIEQFSISADSGAAVVAVVEGSAASGAGLREGDVIVSIDGQPVSSPDDVASAVLGREPGEEIDIEYQRDGETGQTSAVLSTRADAED